jgi:hypothetical protein
VFGIGGLHCGAGRLTAQLSDYQMDCSRRGQQLLLLLNPSAGIAVSLRRPRQQLRQACAFKARSYLSVKVLPSTARPTLAELPPVAPARLGPPVIVLAARDASVRAAPVSSFAHPSLSLAHVPTPLRAALPPRASHPSQRDRSIPRSISVGHSSLARSAMLVRHCS